MFSRRPKFALAASVVLCLAFVTAATAAVMTGWHDLTQSQRNRLILNRANQDLNRNVGVECKEWVQDVVYGASNGAVYPPQNRNDYTWQTHRYVYRYPHPFPISWVEPGQIIQMRWRNRNGATYPHTAIVLDKTSSSMTWIDSNWNRDTVVKSHVVTFRDFDRQVGSYYNVYEIR